MASESPKIIEQAEVEKFLIEVCDVEPRLLPRWSTNNQVWAVIWKHAHMWGFRPEKFHTQIEVTWDNFEDFDEESIAGAVPAPDDDEELLAVIIEESYRWVYFRDPPILEAIAAAEKVAAEKAAAEADDDPTSEEEE